MFQGADSVKEKDAGGLKLRATVFAMLEVVGMLQRDPAGRTLPVPRGTRNRSEEGDRGNTKQIRRTAICQLILPGSRQQNQNGKTDQERRNQPSSCSPETPELGTDVQDVVIPDLFSNA